MKKLSLLIPSIFLFIILSGFSLSSVNAQSSYNWIQNPSFTLYGEYCEDGSFESVSFNSGITYGNFSGTGSYDNTANRQNTGDYSMKLDGGEILWYNLTSDYYTLGADIISIDFYLLSFGSNFNFYANIYYSDSTYDTETITATSVYTQYNITYDLDTSKTVVAIYFEKLSGYTGWIDDISIQVNDGQAQNEIVYGGSNDWQLGQTSNIVAPYFGFIVSGLGHLDTTSCQMDSPDSGYKIIQYIDYLDTDVIQYIDIWVKGANSSLGEGIKISLLYNDGTTDTKTVLASGNGTVWENLNFGKAWIDSNKYITLIYIYTVWNIDLQNTGTLDIDDVGLWASIPYGYSKFDFTISPNPIRLGSYDFDVYSNTFYTLNCYFYNLTDLSLSLNGTYQISDSFGLHTGDMENGFFSLLLSKRGYTTSPFTAEIISITIITDEEVFNVEIIAYWYPTSGGVDTTVNSDIISNFMIVGLLLFAPSVTIGYLGMQINPTMGIITFIGGLTLMGAICLQINVINIWFMFAILIIDTIIVLGLLKTGRIG